MQKVEKHDFKKGMWVFIGKPKEYGTVDYSVFKDGVCDYPGVEVGEWEEYDYFYKIDGVHEVPKVLAEVLAEVLGADCEQGSVLPNIPDGPQYAPQCKCGVTTYYVDVTQISEEIARLSNKEGCNCSIGNYNRDVTKC